ncbi:MAG: hypothetical protein MHM6MM_002578 [Cercozoa sp. M6MM]
MADADSNKSVSRSEFITVYERAARSHGMHVVTDFITKYRSARKKAAAVLRKQRRKMQLGESSEEEEMEKLGLQPGQRDDLAIVFKALDTDKSQTISLKEVYAGPSFF